MLLWLVVLDLSPLSLLSLLSTLSLSPQPQLLLSQLQQPQLLLVSELSSSAICKACAILSSSMLNLDKKFGSHSFIGPAASESSSVSLQLSLELPDV